MVRNEGYKLPRCWIGHPKSMGAASVGMTVPLGKHTDRTGVITTTDCNPKCHCLSPMQAHFCMEGHMTECHAGMNCEEAECSHFESEQGFYDEDDL